MPPSNQREEALFAAAIVRPASERATFLDGACLGEPDLRQRLEALIVAHEQPEKLLGTDAPQSKATIKLEFASEPADEAVGQMLGRYKLLEKVGEGGCGVVYVAEQTQPVRRRVALKVIKLGMDTKAVVARFEAERQALAMMDHPNIAKVLDAGATETGRPYFVMELVRGIRITEYCDQNNLSTKERLDLFIQVCHAIQHAHQKGIIHRDIKPSNILVTLHDGVPVPKVIDFGIAKATEGRLTDATVYTQLHQFIGTPAYMSPEQAEMSGLDVDTRSDIYSLGVLIYELLTGRTPFDAKELMAQGIDAMRKTIREREPERPSTKLATLQGEDLTTTARRRASEAPKLIHMLKGDLDWIVMKALEKDRTRRFETANALAADVHRYLKSEPVVARPPTSVYRFQKLVRRNKTVFAAMGAVAAALIFGFVVSLYLFVREREAHQRALAAEKKQSELRAQAEAGLAAEVKMRQQAEIGQKYSQAGLMLAQRRFDEAEKIVNEVPPYAAAASIFSVLGTVHATREHWARAATNYARVIDLIPDDAASYHYAAPLLVQAGDLEGYRRLRVKILARFADTTDPAVAERSVKDCLILPPAPTDLPKIAKMAETAVAAGQEHKFWPYFQFAKGFTEFRQGRFASAVEWLKPVVSQTNDKYRTVQAFMVLAMAQHQLNQTDEARAALVKGLEIVSRSFPKEGSGNLDEQWQDWIIAHALIREAKEKIEGKDGSH
jgi:tRNA A-37 threonylcarbamoyl transferase component Bud32/tetratricopeptide (TPR) repeat protein